jgi:hypothetical protein
MEEPMRTRLVPAVVILLVVTVPVMAASRVGGMSVSNPPAISLYDTTYPQSPRLLDRTEALLGSGAYAAVHDGLFVAAGSEVRLYDRRAMDQPALAIWPVGSEVLAIADGPERGLVLVLERTRLSLVSFLDGGAPTVVWSTPVDESALAGPIGRLLLRSGNYAYVSDASIPGIRVVKVDRRAPPETVSVYSSVDGPIHDLTLWGNRLTALTERALVVLNAGPAEAPVFTRLGSYSTVYRPSGADVNSRRAFLADGPNLLVLDVDPASPNFLGSPLDSWAAPDEIRAVRIDKNDRAYVLLPGSCEILDVAPFGGR